MFVSFFLSLFLCLSSRLHRLVALSLALSADRSASVDWYWFVWIGSCGCRSQPLTKRKRGRGREGGRERGWLSWLLSPWNVNSTLGGVCFWVLVELVNEQHIGMHTHAYNISIMIFRVSRSFSISLSELANKKSRWHGRGLAAESANLDLRE